MRVPRDQTQLVPGDVRAGKEILGTVGPGNHAPSYVEVIAEPDRFKVTSVGTMMSWVQMRPLEYLLLPQGRGFKLYTPGFTDDQLKILDDSFKRINQKDCTDFINETLAKHKVPKKFDSLDKLLNTATIGYYDVEADYTASDLATDIETTIMLRDAFVNRREVAHGVGTRIWLSHRAFTRSDRYWNRDVADTPSMIVHELLHLAGIDRSIVDSQRLSNEIQEHCRKSGYCNPLVLRH